MLRMAAIWVCWSESQLRSNPAVYAAVTKLKPKQFTDIITFPDPGNPKRIGGYAIFELLEKLPAGQRRSMIRVCSRIFGSSYMMAGRSF